MGIVNTQGSLVDIMIVDIYPNFFSAKILLQRLRAYFTLAVQITKSNDFQKELFITSSSLEVENSW